MVRSKDPEYPHWICHSCGETYGTWYKRGSYVGPPHHCATMHKGICGVCGEKDVTVTEPRDYGHLRAKWREELIKAKPLQDFQDSPHTPPTHQAAHPQS